MNRENIYDDMTESTFSSELKYDGEIIKVYKDTALLPNKTKAPREVVRHRGAVCIVPFTDSGDILAVKQYRYALGRVLLEIPAGKLDPGEAPEVCAMRELAEETGFAAGRLIPIGLLYSAPGFCDETLHMYAAFDLTPCDASPDEDEFLTLVRIPADEIREMILSGEIRDAKTQAAVLKSLELRRSGRI